MSFLKITDAAKRDLLVQELIKTRKNILHDSIDERVDEITAQQSLSKLFKSLTEKIETTTQAIKTLPTLPAAPPLPAIAPPPLAQASTLASDPSTSSQLTTELGKIATEYFKRFTTKTKDADKTYGIYDKGGRFYKKDTEVGIDGDDIIVGDRVYEVTPGLWELIVSKTPNDDIYTLSDKEKYTDILLSTNTLKGNNDLHETHPKSSRSAKWANLLSPIWSKYSRVSKQQTGSSLARASLANSSHTNGAIILPSDITALFDRLDLLLASHRAGNTGARNEIVSICDELRRQGVANDSNYKL
jgi:hypothetical protein